MTATSMSVQEVSDQSVARWRDYVALTKPRISFMVLLTVVAAGFLASTVVSVSALRVFNAVIGTLLVAASGSALNQCVERLLDARMSRTSNRPLPSGRLGLTEVVVFGTITLCVGLVYLWLAISPMVAGIGFATWVMYVWIYTPLKTRTWTNTIVGAVAGAMPVLIGWFATGATIHPWIIGLFSLLFLWQFPHFMAIAWLYREEYEAGGMQMLPVVDRRGFWTAIKAVLSAGLLIPATLLPVVALEGWTQIIYGLVVAALGGFYLYGACLFLRDRSDGVARKLLRISLLHLPLMMLVMVLSAWVCS
ncbi:MAG: heme o synthase [Pirellulaceae bacterium]|nr:heme o synthase [Pirellulaceae bacterium]MEC7978405.1 heme o synthase [Planctomycetota bacterium]MEC8389284.1 heme o synthase [Planctomycetota bacterium]